MKNLNLFFFGKEEPESEEFNSMKMFHVHGLALKFDSVTVQL